MGGQGGCDRRCEVFGKTHEENRGGGSVWGGGGGRVGGVRVDVNEELKFLGKFTTKKIVGEGSGGVWLGGGGSG